MIGQVGNSLPADKDELVRALDNHMAQVESDQAERRAMWALSHWYLMGHRDFSVVNLRTGQLKSARLDEDGNLILPVNIMLQRLDLMKGRLRTIRTAPKVVKEGVGLRLTRKRAAAQALLDAVVPTEQREDTYEAVLDNMLVYGGCGLATALGDDETMGLTADVEAVHPQEIYPFPRMNLDRHQIRGYIRRRYVELNQLKIMAQGAGISPQAFSRNKEKMRVWEMQYGQQVNPAYRHVSGAPAVARPSNKEPDNFVEVVEVREVFLGLPHLQRYILQIGDWIAKDESFGDRRFNPLSFRPAISDSGFWGQGYTDLTYGIIRRFETLISQMVQNAEDLERFGILALPSSMIDTKTTLHDIGSGLKVYPYEADPLAMEQRINPTVIQPANTGTLPLGIAQGVLSVIDQIIPVSPLFGGQVPGRLDSANAVNAVSQQADVPLQNLHASIRALYGAAYRHVASEGARRLSLQEARLPVTRVTADLAGIIVNADGMVSLDNNVLPDTQGLRFTIEDDQFRDRTTRRLEAVTLATQGGQTWDDVRLLDIAEDLDLPIGNPEEKAAAEKEEIAIVTIINDGENPGEYLDNREANVPHIQLRILNARIAGPDFNEYGPEVRQALLMRRKNLMAQMQPTLPDALPRPEDVPDLLRQAGIQA